MPKSLKCRHGYGSRVGVPYGLAAASLLLTWLRTLLRISLQILLLAACLWPSTVLAADADQHLPRFATSTVNPWGYWRRDGSMGGLLVDFAEALAGETEQPFDNELQPYPRVIHSLASGYVDFAVLFDNAPLPDAVERVAHVVDTEILIVGLKATRPLSGRASFESPEDLAGLTIGHIRGSLYGAAFDQARHFRRVPISNIEQGLAMLLKGRIDAMASTDYSMFYALRTMELEVAQIRPLLSIGRTSGSLYMARDSVWSHLATPYREAIERLRQRGELADIFVGQFVWPAPTPQ